jgi:hypothetical protein
LLVESAAATSGSAESIGSGVSKVRATVTACHYPRERIIQ